MIEAIKQIDGYAEMTPAEIVTALQAIRVTNNAIDLGELLFLLNNRGMLVRLIRPADTGEKWSGTVVNMIMYVNENVPPLAGPVNQWFSHITNDRNRTFDTSQEQYGSQLALLTSSFGGQVLGESPNQVVMPTVGDFQAIADLGGGWKYEDLTVEQVTEALDAETKEQIQAATIATVQALVDPLQSKLNAIASWLNTEEALAMTPADYQAYADSLLASDDGNPVGGE